MTTAAAATTDVHALEPDPIEPSPEEVESYVRALQGLAASDPDLARRRAWAQIRLAGQRARSRPAEARDSLNRIFRLGSSPDPPLDGETRGILVTPVMPGPVEPAFRALASAWMPWTGKRFDAAAGQGDNVLVASARTPLRVAWRSYTPETLADGRLAAFRFRTWTGPGKLDADRDVLKIDYDSPDNPDFLIRDILDELVQVVPGANLGKVLLRRGQRHVLVGYFALQPGPG